MKKIVSGLALAVTALTLSLSPPAHADTPAVGISVQWPGSGGYSVPVVSPTWRYTSNERWHEHEYHERLARERHEWREHHGG